MSIRILATVVAGLLPAVTSVIVIFVVIAVRHVDNEGPADRGSAGRPVFGGRQRNSKLERDRSPAAVAASRADRGVLRPRAVDQRRLSDCPRTVAADSA